MVNGCKKKPTSCSGTKFLKFFALLVLGLINLGVDWFFYTRVELIQPGLIYGPPNSTLKLIIFIFCVASTVGFVLEFIHNIDDLNRKHRLGFLSQSLTNFIVIVFTDLPLILLNLIITACHDGQPTMISVLKSSICITMFVVRFILMVSYRCCSTKHMTSKFKCIVDVLSTVGLFLVVLISVKIQLLNIFPTRSSGGFFLVSEPFKFKNMDFVRFKYLDNVGIYAQWPFNQQGNGTNQSDYLWLADINEVIDETFLKITIRTDYEQNANNYTLCMAKKKLEECYTMNKNTGYFNKISSGSIMDLSKLVTKVDTYEMVITKEPAQSYRYLLGYIDYNMNKVSSDGACTSNQVVGSMLYAKFMPFWEGETKSHLRPMGDRFALFNRGIDLQTVDKFWRTGVFGCQMSGDLGPKFNQRLRIDC